MLYQEKVSTRGDVRNLYERVKQDPTISRYRGFTETKSYGWSLIANDYIKEDGEVWFDNPGYDPSFFDRPAVPGVKDVKDSDELFAVASCVPHILYIPRENRRGFIRHVKQQLLCDLVEKYPARAYDSIRFEMASTLSERSKVIEENFKQKDGRYIFHGEFLSREAIEKELEDIPLRIKMTARVRREELENAE